MKDNIKKKGQKILIIGIIILLVIILSGISWFMYRHDKPLDQVRPNTQEQLPPRDEKAPEENGEPIENNITSVVELPPIKHDKLPAQHTVVNKIKEKVITIKETPYDIKYSNKELISNEKNVILGINHKTYSYKITNEFEKSILEISTYEYDKEKDKVIKTTRNIEKQFSNIVSLTYQATHIIETPRVIVGFVAYDKSTKEQVYIDLNLKEHKLKEFYIKSIYNNSLADSFITNSEYIITTNKGGTKFGLYNLKEAKELIKPKYDYLSETYITKNHFVAATNNKFGIIDNNDKKIVKLEYDFIDPQSRFYIIAKNNKMTVMDENYNIKSDFAIDYQSPKNKIPNTIPYPNTCEGYKIGNSYLIMNNNVAFYGEKETNKNEALLIREDGTTQLFNKENLIINYQYPLIAVKETTTGAYVINTKGEKSIGFDIESAKNVNREINGILTLNKDGDKYYYNEKTNKLLGINEFTIIEDELKITLKDTKLNYYYKDKLIYETKYDCESTINRYYTKQLFKKENNKIIINDYTNTKIVNITIE